MPSPNTKTLERRHRRFEIDRTPTPERGYAGSNYFRPGTPGIKTDNRRKPSFLSRLFGGE
jgi:hypothetical protein